MNVKPTPIHLQVQRPKTIHNEHTHCRSGQSVYSTSVGLYGSKTSVHAGFHPHYPDWPTLSFIYFYSMLSLYTRRYHSSGGKWVIPFLHIFLEHAAYKLWITHFHNCVHYTTAYDGNCNNKHIPYVWFQIRITKQ